jgi:transposase
MAFAAAAVERAMTYQQVIMRELAGTLTWLQAADILGIDPRSLRRWRARYEQDPVLGLLDRRRQRPSHLTAPRAEVQSTTARESFETLARSKLGGVLPPNRVLTK